MRDSRPREQLPPTFRGRSFSVTPAIADGITEKRLRGRDLDAPFHGIRSPASPATVEDYARAYATRMPAWAAFGGATAAQLYGLPVPWRMRGPLPLDVVVPTPNRAIRRAGIRGRSVRLSGPPQIRSGVRLCAPQDLWVQLASLLELSELVALGDALIRRDRPLCSRTDLAAAAEGARTGLVNLRAALPLLDDRSESDPESQLRVILLLGGVGPLAVNHEVIVHGRRLRLDLALPHLRIGIEYQGDHHRDRQQWRRDLIRRSELEADGWTIIEVGAADLRDPDALLRRVRAIISRVSERSSDRNRP